MLDDRDVQWRNCLARIASGDGEALTSLYAETAPLLYGLILRLVANRADADEVLLDVYRQVWKEAAEYNASRSRVLWWLSMLARSRAVDRMRSNHRRHLAEQSSRGLDELADRSIDPTVAVDQQRIRTALLTLPAAQKEALELAFYSDLSHSEIAEKLEIPLGTIKTRIRAGMRRLRDSLEVPAKAAS